MKKTLLAVALASSLTSVSAFAADKAPEPSYTLTGNVAAVTDYRFRGVSQTNEKPAAQAGLDLAMKNGIYLGTWTSNVSKWANPGGQQEIDLYGGYKFEVAGIGLDIGAIAYTYPSNTGYVGTTRTVSNNTYEYLIGATLGPASLKVSRTTGNWFGIEATQATYVDLTYAFSISEKISGSAHVGKQTISETGQDALADYGFTDIRLSIAYDLGDGYSAGLAASTVKWGNKTNAEATGGWYLGGDNLDKKLGGSAIVASITKTF